MPQTDQNNTPKTDDKKTQLSEEQIKDTYEQLGLSDPRVIEYLRSFSQPVEPQEPSHHWYGADSGTSLITNGK